VSAIPGTADVEEFATDIRALLATMGFSAKLGTIRAAYAPATGAKQRPGADPGELPPGVTTGCGC
jgi:hypothetical protein